MSIHDDDFITFEKAEELLPIETKAEIAKCLLTKQPLPTPLSPIERTFAFGLSLFIEYEQPNEVEKYCNTEL